MKIPPLTDKLLKAVLEFAKKKKIKFYLVGGILRDNLLGREKENPDIDFSLARGAIKLGREFAREIRAGFVVLDKEHGSCRAVKRFGDKCYTLDFTDFRGKTLEEDLLHRDFTINSLAMELGTDILIDPYRAKADLKSGLVRVVNKKSFDEDPLRILRAFSMSAIFGFKIDPNTLRLAGLKRKKLSLVSCERIRDELFKILDTPEPSGYLLQMDKLKILSVILPEIKPMRGVRQGPYHHLDIWKHTLETVRQLEILLNSLKNNQDIRDYLNEVISSERKRRALIKFGAFLHDIGKPGSLRREGRKIKFHGHERVGFEITKVISGRLRLSNDELNCLKKMVFWHLRPGYLGDIDNPSPRAVFRYFRDTAEEAVSTLLISLADQRSTRGRLTTEESRQRHEKVCFSLIRKYFKQKKEKKIPRLVTGDDLIKKFKLTPSPLIGKMLREIEESQAVGKVRSKEEAFKLAGRFIKP